MYFVLNCSVVKMCEFFEAFTNIWTFSHSQRIYYLFYVWVSVHHNSILYKEPTRCNFGSIVYWSLQNHSTCFGRFLLPSSGVLTTAEAATGACHGSEWCISTSAMATDLRHPYWIYIIPTHGMHQWLLLQLLILLMMDAESVRNM